ncbi:MAG: (E)-4-hydroxy-3-methylbut-2-enyl-diphosphate synthase [Bacteroidota bacterium]
MSHPYTHSLYQRRRIETVEVKIGDVPVGGKNPIRIQSMTTTSTMDTEATVQQTLRMVESGAEYVRITAPNIKEANNLKEIRDRLHALGCKVPLIADIHFTPNAAEVAARIVEKVRVNPGNYADKKKFKVIEYTDQTYQEALDRIHKRFSPLVQICKEHGTAMRIGTNHGSLSDRIMSRYGDTPLGMVESALEFIRICEMYNFDQLVVSMKASNPQVMVQAYRLLMQKMIENGKIYPLHLGVTEAGEGEDGRIKSAQGIAALLMDGIGDTVRVSLTEEPEYESPVAKFLVEMYDGPDMHQFGIQGRVLPENPVDPYAFKRRASREIINLGQGHVPRVIADYRHTTLKREHLTDAGYQYSALLDKYNFSDMAADYIYLGAALPPFELPGGLKPVVNADLWRELNDRTTYFPWYSSVAEFRANGPEHTELNFVAVTADEVESVPETTERVALVLEAQGRSCGHAWRWMAARLKERKINAPIVLSTSLPERFDFYNDDHLPEKYQLTEEAKQQLYLAGISGSTVVDGQIDGILLRPSDRLTNRTSFGILQASRLRMTKTEYISCPSCGRTLFDLQETTARIRKRTEHLKGVKIGIMGCIVNGPGEMADADYGYVGVGPGKIALYRGQNVVERGVKTAEAVDKLIELIAADGKWIEPAVTETA